MKLVYKSLIGIVIVIVVLFSALYIMVNLEERSSRKIFNQAEQEGNYEL